MWANTSLAPKALWKLKEFAEACGETVPDGPWDFEPVDMMGRKLILEVETREYEGKLRNNVTKFHSPNGFVANGDGKEDFERGAKPRGRERARK